MHLLEIRSSRIDFRFRRVFLQDHRARCAVGAKLAKGLERLDS